MTTKLRITATHPVDTAKYGCNFSDEFTVHPDYNGGWFIDGKWGCSKTYPTVREAVHAMARDHGCHLITYRVGDLAGPPEPFQD